MTTPTTPRPASEAVEAALVYCRGHQGDEVLTGSKIKERNLAFDLLYKLHPGGNSYYSAARILAAEVEWLRAEMDRRHREYSSALNRRVDVENTLAQFAAGKRDILSRDEARELAVKLGVPPATKETK